MDHRIEKIKRFRLFLLDQIAGLPAEQLNKIPAGYNNNIIWNMGHLICAQQSLCYFRAGQAITVEDRYFSPYRTGTKPETFIPAAEIETIKTLFLSTIDDLQVDLDKKIFQTYSPSEGILKLYGIELKSIDDALEFLLYHEGFHSGYVIALKRSYE